jgi:hypothetical protein
MKSGAQIRLSPMESPKLKTGVKCYCSTHKLLQPMLQSVTYFRFRLLRDPKMESDQNVSVTGRAGWGGAPVG